MAMKAKQIEVGGRYVAKVSGQLTVVRVVSTATSPITGRQTWMAENEKTGRRIAVASAQRFRYPAEKEQGKGPRTFGDASDGELRAIIEREERDPGSTGGGAATASAVLTQREERRSSLWISNRGVVSCPQHGGEYLREAVESDPRADYHLTPLDTWMRLKPAHGLGDQGCDECARGRRR
jgi:hypothetical protein